MRKLGVRVVVCVWGGAGVQVHKKIHVTIKDKENWVEGKIWEEGMEKMWGESNEAYFVWECHYNLIYYKLILKIIFYKSKFPANMSAQTFPLTGGVWKATLSIQGIPRGKWTSSASQWESHWTPCRHKWENTRAPRDPHSEQNLLQSKMTKHKKTNHQEKSNEEAEPGSQTLQMLKR